MNKFDYMRTLPVFKNHMTSAHVPNYVIRYCECLDGQKWEWFYNQMKEAVVIVSDIDYMFYVLKWILNRDFDDLVYEIYFQDYMDPEMRPDSLIADQWAERLHEKYIGRLKNDLALCAGEGHE